MLKQFCVDKNKRIQELESTNRQLLYEKTVLAGKCAEMLTGSAYGDSVDDHLSDMPQIDSE